ncbi:MAG: hypothetical protein FWB71_06855 [Defluviitaleaceae bacterium]|nr:hypothetical protein [Defluviitaleaceae bacterium]
MNDSNFDDTMRLSLYIDDMLPPDEMARLEADMRKSPELAREYESMRRIARTLRGLPEIEPPADMRDDIWRGLRSFARRSRIRRYFGALGTAAAAIAVVAAIIFANGIASDYFAEADGDFPAPAAAAPMAEFMMDGAMVAGGGVSVAQTADAADTTENIWSNAPAGARLVHSAVALDLSHIPKADILEVLDELPGIIYRDIDDIITIHANPEYAENILATLHALSAYPITDVPDIPNKSTIIQIIFSAE